jgi:hypothetical protein
MQHSQQWLCHEKMNRAFYIVAVPAILVAAAYLAVFYGQVVPRPLALGVGLVAAIALVVRALRK